MHDLTWLACAKIGAAILLALCVLVVILDIRAKRRLREVNQALARSQWENISLRRQVGKARLLADLRRDAAQLRAEFDLSADSVPQNEPRAFFRRQI